MALKLYNNKDEIVIPMNQLKGGEIGVVVDPSPENNGLVVVRNSSDSTKGPSRFTIIGDPSGDDSSNGYSKDCSLCVRKLPKGTIFILD